MIRHLALPLALLTLTLAACGGDGATTASPPAAEEGVEHIHGLGVDPADGALMIATHSGLFRAPRGEARPQRVGDRRQDTMGFTVVGRGRFLGSGHPDARDGLPPLLGLIRSDDAGRTWRPVSLLGEADFHVLRTAGTRVLGVDATSGLVHASDDGGRTWARRTPPGPLVDLAARPGDPDTLVAAGEDDLHVSRDTGRTWRPLADGRTGLLAWPRARTLVLADAGGGVHRSADGGATWRDVGQAGGPPAALAADGDDLYVALHDNRVRRSVDGGRTWITRIRP